VAGGPIVRMYSRRTCGLCDEARAVIQAEQARSSFEFDEAFIDGDDSLEREYGLRVPVVLVDGVEEFEFTIDPARLRELITRSRPT
jgi:glutaredoxin